jgi:hypothetical protein
MKKCVAEVDPDQRDSILVQFLQGVYSASRASLTLSSVDHLPSLKMLLLEPITTFRKIRNYCKKNGKCPHVFKNFEEGPPTQPIDHPSASPLQPMQRKENRVPSLSIIVRQRTGTFSLGVNEHAGNLDILVRQVKLVLSIRANSTCSPEEGEHEPIEGIVR